MRREIARKLQRVFSERVSRLSPPFVQTESEYIDQRDRLYVAQFQPSFFAFLCLQLSPKGYDEFTVEVSWNRRPEYPFLAGFDMPVDIPEIEMPRDHPLNDSFKFRIGNLIPPHDDLWWSVDIPLQVENVVDRVIKLIDDYAIPYLHQEAEQWAGPSDGNSQHTTG